VGCKVVSDIFDMIAGFTFYLNYVGCKEDVSWDEDFEWRGFYLNYVGCKEIRLHQL